MKLPVYYFHIVDGVMVILIWMFGDVKYINQRQKDDHDNDTHGEGDPRYVGVGTAAGKTERHTRQLFDVVRYQFHFFVLDFFDFRTLVDLAHDTTIENNIIDVAQVVSAQFRFQYSYVDISVRRGCIVRRTTTTVMDAGQNRRERPVGDFYRALGKYFIVVDDVIKPFQFGNLKQIVKLPTMHF